MRKILLLLIALIVGLAGQTAMATTKTYVFEGQQTDQTQFTGYFYNEASPSTHYNCTPSPWTYGTTGSLSFTLANGITLTLSSSTNKLLCHAENGLAAKGEATLTVSGGSTYYIYHVRLLDRNGNVVMLDANGSPVTQGGVTSCDYFNTTKSFSQTYSASDGIIFKKIQISYATNIADDAYQGSGTENAPYIISSTSDLDLLATLVNAGNDFSGKFFQQGADITYTHTTNWNDANSTENNYTAIGTESNSFKGTFDGGGHTISGIRIYKGGGLNDSDLGLFGFVMSGGTVKRVTLADARITGFDDVGGIAGSTFSCTIEDCTVDADVCIHAVQSNACYHGGIVGFNQSPVRRCISRASLTVANTTGCKDFGGIAGAGNNTNTITDCIANGAVIPDVNGRGAIVGYNNTGTLTRNYYRGCTVAGVANATGVGKGNSESGTETSDVNGAQALYAITLGTNVTLNRSATATLPGTNNKTYANGADINGQPYAYATATVSLGYSGEAPEGYHFNGFIVNGTAIDGDTFEMPLEDVTVTAALLSRYTFDSETGVLALNWGEFNKDNKWGSEVTASAVKSVTATSDVSFTGDCSDLFRDFSNCESMDLSSVNTDSVTNMSAMFKNCKSLDLLDVSGFNTGNVTDMRDMFYNCWGLDSLDVSGFNTENVTNMSHMFYSCSALTSLDVSGFNTSNVTNMYSMFDNCPTLTTLDVSGFNTGNVIYMGSMFYNCKKLTSLDVSGFNTGNVTDMSAMFSYCKNLTSLDVSGFNTENASYMGGMFYGCSALTSLDVSGFNTGNVTDMTDMFMYCSALTSLDLSGWNTANVEDMYEMFYECSGLTTIYAGTGWSTESVEESALMFAYCSALVGGRGTTYNSSHTDHEYARIDKGEVEPGYLSGMFLLTLPEGVTATPAAALTHGDVSYYAAGTAITLSYTGEMPEDCHFIGFIVNDTAIDGDTFEMPFEDVTVTAAMLSRYTFDSETGVLALNWGEFNKDNKWGSDVTASAVKSVTATSEVSFTGDCSDLFRDFSNCESIELGNVNTDSVTNMSYMFCNCKALDSLDLSGWNTGNVTNMGGMFYNCWALDSLDVSGFNTENVTNMRYMFSICSALTSLDVSGFNTKNVNDMCCMFWICPTLTTLDVSGFNTENVTYMGSMFDGCKNLTSLDVSGFNTGNVEYMSYMFNGCSGLTSLDVSGFNTGNVEDMSYMFCGCSGLTSLDVSGWNTRNVTFMYGMFEDCSGLTSLDVSGWNTWNVTNMSEMFRGCSALTTIYAGTGWDAWYVPESSGMFYDCQSLVGGMGTTYDENHTDNEYARIDGGPSNPGYFTQKSAVVVVPGDVNGDGEVTTVDVTALYNLILFGDDSAIVNGDQNGDGNITTTDVTIIYRIILGINN